LPSIGALFMGFFSIGVIGFGGVLPWARRMVVEQRRWLTPEEFIDALSMCQFVPGPNIVNLTVALGGRFQGPLGSLAGVLGLLAAPMVIVISLSVLVGQVSDNRYVIGGLHGMAAAAAGLVIAMAVKIAMPMIHRRHVPGLAMAAIAIVAVGLLRLPLITTLLVLAPTAIAIERIWRMRRKSS
jgi:chromate transporter